MMSNAHRMTARRSWKWDINIKIQLQQSRSCNPRLSIAARHGCQLSQDPSLPPMGFRSTKHLNIHFTSSAWAAPTYWDVPAMGLAFRMFLHPSEGLAKPVRGQGIPFPSLLGSTEVLEVPWVCWAGGPGCMPRCLGPRGGPSCLLGASELGWETHGARSPTRTALLPSPICPAPMRSGSFCPERRSWAQS